MRLTIFSTKFSRIVNHKIIVLLVYRLSPLNIVSIFGCPSPPWMPVCTRRVDPSVLSYSLSFYRHPYTYIFPVGLTLSINNKQDRTDGKIKKWPPKGMEGVYKENSDFLGKKTNRKGEKHKLHDLILPRVSSDNFRKYAVR